jgi:glutamate transport system ATP-binding protein
MPQSEPFLVFDHVDKHFGDVHVLQDINLRVDPGEVVVVMGPSGSGKSTLCRTINRLETIDSGQIRVDGRPLPSEGRALVDLRTRIGMVFQSFNLFAHLSVIDNITIGPMRVQGVPRDEAHERARDLLRRVGIEEKADRMPAQLSGGQQQRAAIARALAMNPDMMLFDEPTSALDPEMIQEVLDVIRELAEGGMTMLVITHELGFAQSAAHRAVFMADGRIVEDSPAGDFFREPASERARTFLSQILH